MEAEALRVNARALRALRVGEGMKEGAGKSKRVILTMAVTEATHD